MTEDELTDLLMRHYPTQGVMASPGHWAYQAREDGKGAWFAHCGTGWADQQGCGWTSEPHTYIDKMQARRAALAHVAHEILHPGVAKPRTPYGDVSDAEWERLDQSP